jgi:hypothetical protein
MVRFVVALALAAALPFAMAIEEPAYQVERRLGDVEIRAYAPYVVAEVRVDAAFRDAGNEAFPVLAGYIFGKNKGKRSLEMTAPVTQVAEPVKLEMTAPVTQSAAAEGAYAVQFVLPRDVTLATAPEPLDPRVQVRAVPARRVAVIRYSGLWSQANYDEHLARLRSALEQAGVVPVGEPEWARYDPPIKPWFLRRNEIWLPVP